jgi:Cof subfamily protein (haloacid dehalogenase superfamily)
MIKLIACDMDGTLLNGEGKIDKEFFEIFERLMDKNVKFAVASGRQYFTLLDNFEDVKDKIVYIAENGTMVKYNDEELYSCILDRKDAMEIIRDVEGIADAYPVVCGKSCAYINTNKKEVLEEIKKYYKSYKKLENFSEINDEILKIAVLDFNGSERNSYKTLNPKWKDKVMVTISGEIWIDLFNKEANKGLAVRVLQDKFNINKEETMAFGDYFNDIEMLQEAHYSYAMANAPEGVKKHANFIAKSNNEKGVIEAIKEVVFNNEI